MYHFLIGIAGWIGAVMIILAYFLLILKRRRSASKVYHPLNLTGSIGVLANAAYYSAYPSATINAVWIDAIYLQTRKP